MTSAELILARDGDAGATPAAVTLWRSIVGDDTVDPIFPRRVKPEPAGAALDAVSAYVGSGTEVSVHDPCGGHFSDRLVISKGVRGNCLGFHGSHWVEESRRTPTRLGAAIRPFGEVGSNESLARSCAKIRRAGVI